PRLPSRRFPPCLTAQQLTTLKMIYGGRCAQPVRREGWCQRRGNRNPLTCPFDPSVLLCKGEESETLACARGSQSLVTGGENESGSGEEQGGRHDQRSGFEEGPRRD